MNKLVQSRSSGIFLRFFIQTCPVLEALQGNEYAVFIATMFQLHICARVIFGFRRGFPLDPQGLPSDFCISL